VVLLGFLVAGVEYFSEASLANDFAQFEVVENGAPVEVLTCR
jgi:hypothetical protein